MKCSHYSVLTHHGKKILNNSTRRASTPSTAVTRRNSFSCVNVDSSVVVPSDATSMYIAALHHHVRERASTNVNSSHQLTSKESCSALIDQFSQWCNMMSTNNDVKSVANTTSLSNGVDVLAKLESAYFQMVRQDYRLVNLEEQRNYNSSVLPSSSFVETLVGLEDVYYNRIVEELKDKLLCSAGTQDDTAHLG